MKTKVHNFLGLFDLPGGVILGLWSLAMLVMAISAFICTAKGHPTDIPSSVKEIFNWILTAFAASKTMQSIWGKVTRNLSEKPNSPSNPEKPVS